MFVVMLLSVLLYGCESWALSTAQLRRLEVFQRGLLRQILGVRRSDRVSDHDLYDRCDGIECIEAHWRRRMLRWLGHIGRMEASRIPKQLMWATLPGGRRPVGRPPPSLPDTYAQHLATLDQQITDLRRKSNTRGFTWLDACADKDAWQKLVG